MANPDERGLYDAVLKLHIMEIVYFYIELARSKIPLTAETKGFALLVLGIPSAMIAFREKEE